MFHRSKGYAILAPARVELLVILLREKASTNLLNAADNIVLCKGSRALRPVMALGK